jgi:hypothetical protein
MHGQQNVKSVTVCQNLWVYLTRNGVIQTVIVCTCELSLLVLYAVSCVMEISHSYIVLSRPTVTVCKDVYRTASNTVGQGRSCVPQLLVICKGTVHHITGHKSPEGE